MSDNLAEDFTSLLDLKAQRKTIAKEQKDTYNRLHSIAEDAAFVEEAVSLLGLPIVPNLRCGAWYVNPGKAAQEAVYWKSTDGHHPTEMQFNLRRSNLHIVTRIVDEGGVVIVDSTRKGKRFPDALAKTIPTWCATLNTARMRMAAVHPLPDPEQWRLHGALATLPSAVGRNQHAQIEARITAFADELLASAFDLTQSVLLLDKPLRPIFVTPASQLQPRDPNEKSDFYPVVCLSASKLVDGGSIERSHGFSYVQGSGDDHELWSEGLTPSLFWRHRAELLAADRDDLPDLARSIVGSASTAMQDSTTLHVQTVRSSCVDLCIGGSTAGPLVGDSSTMRVVVRGLITDQEQPASDPSIHVVTMRSGARGLDDLSKALGQIVSLAVEACRSARRVLVICGTEKDQTDGAVAVAISVLEEAYDGEGRLRDAGAAVTHSKDTIRRRLQWIIESTHGSVNPSRAVLKRVNDYFLSRSKRK